jgi:hypothetical protein
MNKTSWPYQDSITESERISDDVKGVGECRCQTWRLKQQWIKTFLTPLSFCFSFLQITQGLFKIVGPVC